MRENFWHLGFNHLHGFTSIYLIFQGLVCNPAILELPYLRSIIHFNSWTESVPQTGIPACPFDLNDQLVAGHWSPKASPGWKAERREDASPTIAPSRIINRASLFQITPPNPSHNSVTRKMDRVRIAIVARSRLMPKALNMGAFLVCFRAGDWSALPRRQRHAKSRETTRKTPKLTTCKMRPAIIILIPICFS